MTYRHFNNETTRSSVLKAVADVENASAWQRLFDLYAGFVFSIARSKGLKDEDADDVVQIVFADLARLMPTFRYDRAKGRFRSYLIGFLAASCGWCAPGESRSRRDLLPTFDLGTLPRRPFVVSGETDVRGKIAEREKR